MTRLLLVTSPPLRDAAGHLLQQYFPGSSLLVWDPSCPQDKARVHRQIMGGSWSLSVSFYNDYIFQSHELAHLGCTLNIHPALPALRGRGYDTLPIIQGHSQVGTTLHLVDEQIDSGTILEVKRQPLPPGMDYPSLRRLTQELSLHMLETVLQRCLAQPAVALQDYWRGLAQDCDERWSGEFLCSRGLACLLLRLSREQPDHPMVRQLPRKLLLEPV